MITNHDSQTVIPTTGTFRVNNIHANFVGADGDDGTTVIKPLASKLFTELHMMYVMRLNHHTFSTDNHLTNSGVKILNPFNQNGLNLSNRYEIKRNGNSFKIQKINAKGKVFQFFIHVSIENNKLKYRYVWKNKPRELINGYKVKMRMYASHQLGINPSKLYTVAA